jgi:hypothetical protein
MWVSRKKYQHLLKCEVDKEELLEETQRLAELVSAQVTDRKVGPWCRDCMHIGHDYSESHTRDWTGFAYAVEHIGKVQYCKKHLHEICPEFERTLPEM